MRGRLILGSIITIAIMSFATTAGAGDIERSILKNQLNSLESRAVQRMGRQETTADLLDRQRRRLARQSLNTLKTKEPRSSIIPLFEGKLRRSQPKRGSSLRR